MARGETSVAEGVALMPGVETSADEGEVDEKLGPRWPLPGWDCLVSGGETVGKSSAVRVIDESSSTVE